MQKYNLTVLLPGRLDAAFVDLFNKLASLVIWNPDESRLDELIAKNDIDVAFEWQYGLDDHTLLDIVKKHNKNTAVILCLNGQRKLYSDFLDVGYFDFIDVPFKIEELQSIFEKVVQLKN